MISSKDMRHTGQHSHLQAHFTQAKLWPQGMKAASASASQQILQTSELKPAGVAPAAPLAPDTGVIPFEFRCGGSWVLFSSSGGWPALMIPLAKFPASLLLITGMFFKFAMSFVCTTKTVLPIFMMSLIFSGCRLLCSPSALSLSQVLLVEPTSYR